MVNLEAVRAEDYLRDRGGSLSPDDVRRLTLIATGSEAAAADAFSYAEDARLRREAR